MRILVLGYMIRGPWGGMVWHHLQYLLGLSQLGHEVYFLEDSDDYPSCYTPWSAEGSTDPTYGIEFLRTMLVRVGLEEGWAYFDAHRTVWHGPLTPRIHEIIGSCDLLLNLSGVNPLRPWLQGIPVRALIDTDPVFVQVRHLTKAADRQQALLHNRFFSYGECFGHPCCGIPDDGFPWRPTRQPITMDVWNSNVPPSFQKFTTVMQWKSYPPVEYQGKRYGMKSESFAPFLGLPLRCSCPLEMAVKGIGDQESTLREHGWAVIDPVQVTADPSAYQDYILGSLGEFSVAKHGYVASRSGWFSERSAAYLASGRPVVVQNTGFTEWLPSGRGVIAFDNLDEAVEGIEEVAGNFEFHSRAAREITHEYFRHEKVLGKLLEDCFA
jgi:hypothetical protein